MTRARSPRVLSTLLLAGALLVGSGVVACGKYGPPQRPEPAPERAEEPAP